MQPSQPSGLDAVRIGPGDRVLALGGYGVRNVGDEAILSGLMNWSSNTTLEGSSWCGTRR